MNLHFLVVILLGLIFGWISTAGSKSQYVRLLDILWIGPLMIYAGWSSTPLTSGLRLVLIFFGSTTITYNLKNLLRFNK